MTLSHYRPFRVLLAGQGLAGCLLLPRLPAVMPAPHDISPALEEQLVLELEAWVAILEGIEVFPGC